LRAEQPLNIHPTQDWSFNPMAEFLRANVAHQMLCSIRAAIRVTIEAGHTPCWLFRSSDPRLH
jgi:hypothetical protein